MKDEGMTFREEILDGAREAVMKQRNNVYGPPTQDFDRTAGVLNALGFSFEGKPVQSHHVAIVQIAVKLSRIGWSPTHKDSWLDVAGYAACGYECAASNEAHPSDDFDKTLQKLIDDFRAAVVGATFRQTFTAGTSESNVDEAAEPQPAQEGVDPVPQPRVAVGSDLFSEEDMAHLAVGQEVQDAWNFTFRKLESGKYLRTDGGGDELVSAGVVLMNHGHDASKPNLWAQVIA